jgi:hypothetical protein
MSPSPRRWRPSVRRIVILAAAGVAGGSLAALVALRLTPPEEGPRPFRRESRLATVSSVATPFASSAEIPNDTEGASVDTLAETPLDGKSLEQILAFRSERVARLARLGLFPNPYDPLQGHGQRIYASIAPGAKWLGPAPYYLANPYVLVVFTCANHVTPLNLLCPGVAIRYSDRRIEERREGESARCWLRFVHEPPYADRPGHVRIVMVNAYDAGFRYAHVDRSHSSNLEPSGDPANIVNGLFSQSSFFHLGRYQANNLSPEDPRGWLRLTAADARTTIRMKLWRDRPQSTADTADFTYEATIAP